MLLSQETEFTAEQKEYLKGFFSGIKESGYDSGQSTASSAPVEEENVFGTPLEDLCKEETIKYEKNGLDCWLDMVAHAKEGKLPAGGDVFRFKFHGLFYVGAVCFLTIYSFVDASTFFMIIGCSSAMAFVASLFMDEPQGHTTEVLPDGTVQMIEVS